MPSETGPGDLHEFDQVQRVMRRVGRMAAVGIPTWILLLFLFPLSGLGPLLCLTGATLVTAMVVVWSERRRGPVSGDDGAAPDEPRAPMGALAGAGIAVGVVVLLVYVIFVIRAA